MAIDWLRYVNQGATRNQPLSPQLVQALNYLPQMGVSMEVFSGGQPSSGPHRTGSHRHDNGNAADVFFYKDGRQLNWANPQDRPIFEQIVSQGREHGVTGFGAGEGYMRPGSMHIGFGNPAVWGAGGNGANAPDWLRAAFNGSAAPVPAPAAEPPGKIGGDGMVARDFDTQVAAATNTPPQGGILGSVIADAGIPQGVADYAAADDSQKSPLATFLEKLGQVDTPAPMRFGQMGDARDSGGLLLKALSQPTIADYLLRKRMA